MHQTMFINRQILSSNIYFRQSKKSNITFSLLFKVNIFATIILVDEHYWCCYIFGCTLHQVDNNGHHAVLLTHSWSWTRNPWLWPLLYVELCELVNDIIHDGNDDIDCIGDVGVGMMRMKWSQQMRSCNHSNENNRWMYNDYCYCNDCVCHIHCNHCMLESLQSLQ